MAQTGYTAKRQVLMHSCDLEQIAYRVNPRTFMRIVVAMCLNQMSEKHLLTIQLYNPFFVLRSGVKLQIV